MTILRVYRSMRRAPVLFAFPDKKKAREVGSGLCQSNDVQQVNIEFKCENGTCREDLCREGG